MYATDILLRYNIYILEKYSLINVQCTYAAIKTERYHYMERRNMWITIRRESILCMDIIAALLHGVNAALMPIFIIVTMNEINCTI